MEEEEVGAEGDGEEDDGGDGEDHEAWRTGSWQADLFC